MAQITVKVNGRAYRLACGDGEEARLNELTAHVNAHVDRLAAQFGQIGVERLLVMAAIHIADELFDARAAALPPPMDPAPETATEPPPERRPARRRTAQRGDAVADPALAEVPGEEKPGA